MASRSEPIQRAAHDAFESWVTALSAMLTARGVAGTEATTLARWAIAALEGALVLARAARDDTVVTQLAEITAETLDRRLAA
jgi:TetR/AcrR family transcriptional repressor of lmrAB and yxaGH operons